MNQTAPSISLLLLTGPGEAPGKALPDAERALAALCRDYEILIPGEAGPGAAAAGAGSAAPATARVRIFDVGSPPTYGAALSAGIQAARGELIAVAGGGSDPGEIDRLLPLIRSCAAVCGYRLARRAPPLRRALERIYNLLVATLFGVGVRDCDGPLKLFRRSAVRGLELEAESVFANAELLARLQDAGETVAEVGISEHRPARGAAVGPLLRRLTEALRFWWCWALFPKAPVASGSPDPRASRWRAFAGGALLCLLAGPLLLVGADHPLMDPDETRYAEIPATMLASGDFVVPRLAGEAYLDKPPLLYWLTAASYRALGPSARAARLPAAAAALLTTLLLYGFGRRLVGEEPAALGALLLLTAIGFLGAGRFLSTDGLLTLWVTGCLLSAAWAVGGERFHPGAWAFAGLACGLGFLTKGPVILLLCLPPLALGRWLARAPVSLTLRRWLLFAVPAAGVALPWFVLISRRQPGFLGYFFWRHNVVRYTAGFIHAEPWWFFLAVFPLMALPGTALLPSLASFLFGRSSGLRRLRRRELGIPLLAALWILGFFSLSKSKLPSYVLPALPVTALLLGFMLSQALRSRGCHPTLRAVAQRIGRRVAWGAMAAVGAVAALDILFDGEPVLSGHGSAWALIAAVTALGAAAARRWRQPAPGWWIPAAALSWTCLLFLFTDLYPEVVHLRELPVQARAAALELGGPPVPIVAVGSRVGPGLFYMRSDEIEDLELDELERLDRYSELYPEVLLIADPELASRVRSILPGTRVEEMLGNEHLFLVRRAAGEGPVALSAGSGAS